MTKLYTAKPSEDDPEVWIVYDMYQPLPAKPIFVGTMEEAGAVADAKNAPHWDRLASPIATKLKEENDKLKRAWLSLNERMATESASHRDYFEKSQTRMAELNLIAASLLEALRWFTHRRRAIQAKHDLHGPADTAAAMRVAFTNALAAIAKAEGRS